MLGHGGIKNPASPYSIRVRGKVVLFPLYGSSGLRRQVIKDSVDAGNFAGDTAYDLRKEVIGDLLDGSGHGVFGVDRADDAGPLEAAQAILYANGFIVRNDGEVLPYLAL